MKQLNFLLSAVLLTGATLSPLSARETALIKIDPDRTISEIDPNIYSSFLEPLGNRFGGVVYGPLYDPKSPFSDENGFRKDYIQQIKTLNIALEEMDRLWLPVTKDWRLNERHYGALQGLNKAETAEKHGADQVFIWRRSFDIPPPALTADDERYPVNDPRYRNLPKEVIPLTESLKTTIERVLPYWEAEIAPKIRAGQRLIISAHGNSIRALVKHLEGLSDEEIPLVEIPTGVPLVYKLNADLKSVKKFYLGQEKEAA